MNREGNEREHIIALTVEIVRAHVANNNVPIGGVPALIAKVHDTLRDLRQPVPATVAPPVPAVSIRASVKPDFIVCLEDGKKLKMLKRHLMATYKMTPDDYRAKWNLPPDYPMVAPNYAELRRGLAKRIGLGTRARKG